MSATAMTVYVPLALVVVTDLWVYADARLRQGTGREPGVQVGSLRIESPEAWAIVCLVLFVVAFPAYVIARRRAE